MSGVQFLTDPEWHTSKTICLVNLLTGARHLVFSTNHLAHSNKTEHNLNQEQHNKPKQPDEKTTTSQGQQKECTRSKICRNWVTACIMLHTSRDLSGKKSPAQYLHCNTTYFDGSVAPDTHQDFIWYFKRVLQKSSLEWTTDVVMVLDVLELSWRQRQQGSTTKD